jgi:hypothetical protein
MFIAKNTKKCAWCGKQFTPSSPNNKYCCEHCKREGRREKGRNRRMKHYYKKKTWNTSTEALTVLGSKGTSCSCKRKEDFHEEMISIRKVMKRLGIA